MNRELNPAAVAGIVAVVLVVVIGVCYLVLNPPHRIPVATKPRPTAGGPAVPPPLPPDQIRHGPVETG